MTGKDLLEAMDYLDDEMVEHVHIRKNRSQMGCCGSCSRIVLRRGRCICRKIRHHPPALGWIQDFNTVEETLDFIGHAGMKLSDFPGMLEQTGGGIKDDGLQYADELYITANGKELVRPTLNPQRGLLKKESSFY